MPRPASPPKERKHSGEGRTVENTTTPTMWRGCRECCAGVRSARSRPPGSRSRRTRPQRHGHRQPPGTFRCCAVWPGSTADRRTRIRSSYRGWRRGSHSCRAAGTTCTATRRSAPSRHCGTRARSSCARIRTGRLPSSERARGWARPGTEITGETLVGTLCQAQMGHRQLSATYCPRSVRTSYRKHPYSTARTWTNATAGSANASVKASSKSSATRRPPRMCPSTE